MPSYLRNDFSTLFKAILYIAYLELILKTKAGYSNTVLDHDLVQSLITERY